VPTDVLQTPQELEAKLAEQLDFLTTSADRFDRGATAEAKRLALAIRILVYDYRQSRSVLGQLGRKGVKFFDSAGEYDSGNIADHWGLVLMAVGGGLPSYVAPLDDLPTGQGVWTDFDSWWGKVVFRDAQKREITRGELVLAVANQDGGAHVDPSLREVYAALSRQNSLGWTMVMGADKRPADPAHLAAVRQVAHEILKSLVPDYVKKPIRPPGTAVFAGLRIEAVSKAGKPGVQPGRNDPCHCGSRKKFKKCHGK
jgi:hypothetical protein